MKFGEMHRRVQGVYYRVVCDIATPNARLVQSKLMLKLYLCGPHGRGMRSDACLMSCSLGQPAGEKG